MIPSADRLRSRKEIAEIKLGFYRLLGSMDHEPLYTSVLTALGELTTAAARQLWRADFKEEENDGPEV